MKTRQFKFESSSNINTMKMSYNGKYVYVSFKSVKPGCCQYYRYTGVPVDVFYSVINAESVGSSFSKLIRNGGYTFTQVRRWRDEKTGRFVKAA